MEFCGSVSASGTALLYDEPPLSAQGVLDMLTFSLLMAADGLKALSDTSPPGVALTLRSCVAVLIRRVFNRLYRLIFPRLPKVSLHRCYAAN